MVDEPCSSVAVAPENLRSARALSLARLTSKEKLPFTHLVSCGSSSTYDTVVIDVEVELGQLAKYPILPVERIEIHFDVEDQKLPETIAARQDFPSVPHLNFVHGESRRCLCLFEEPYREIQSRWTAAMLVERIRNWLRLTARGELHAADQPLEPLLLDAHGVLILPHGLLQSREGATDLKLLSLTCHRDHRQHWVIQARNIDSPGGPNQGLPVAAAILCCPPRHHGIITRAPTTLKDLHAFLAETEYDLLGFLRSRLLDWNESAPEALDSLFVLIVVMPKTRTAGGNIEANEVCSFWTGETIRQVGKSVGRWDIHDGKVASLIAIDGSQCGQDIPTGLLNTMFTTSREELAFLNRRAKAENLRITAVGCGALGSQVVMNAARGAFGHWTLIDDDLFLPHNLARHAASTGVGMPKAELMAMMVNTVAQNSDAPAASIVANVLEPGANKAKLQKAFESAQVIVDMSASLAVARALSLDIGGAGRRVSLFLNPTGTDLTLLAEDARRHFTLDALEMQYYRSLINCNELQGHLRAPSDPVRVGRSCRDVSARVPQELVALHAAIGTRALRAVTTDDNPAIKIWRIDDSTLSVASVTLVPTPVYSTQIGAWGIRLDQWLIERLIELRASKLPCETGGVLVGSVDLHRKILYIVDTIPSPIDSQEWPLIYIRGHKGLRQSVTRLSATSAAQLHYIGEWHSHPDNCSCSPSADDLTAFKWLAEAMEVDGLPTLMLIVGQTGYIAPFLNEMLAERTPAPFLPIGATGQKELGA